MPQSEWIKKPVELGKKTSERKVERYKKYHNCLDPIGFIMCSVYVNIYGIVYTIHRHSNQSIRICFRF